MGSTLDNLCAHACRGMGWGARWQRLCGSCLAMFGSWLRHGEVGFFVDQKWMTFPVVSMYLLLAGMGAWERLL